MQPLGVTRPDHRIELSNGKSFAIDQRLQTFLHQPPGADRAIVYVGVNNVTKLAYVGKHIHGSTGDSFYNSRFKVHQTSPVCKRLYNSIQKHGIEAFSWYILDNVPEEEVLDEEAHWISKNGLDTLSPSGYNLILRHDFGGSSVDHRKAIRASAPKRVATFKKTINSPTSTFRSTMSNSMKSIRKHEAVTENGKTERTNKMIATISTAASKLKRAIGQRKAIEEGKGREERIASRNATINAPGSTYRADQSKRAIALRKDPEKETKRKASFMVTVYANGKHKKNSVENHEKYIANASANVLPDESDRSKRVKGGFYRRPDGKIGRWDGFGLRPIEGRPQGKSTSVYYKRAKGIEGFE
jgi:hypothetical protein